MCYGRDTKGRDVAEKRIGELSGKESQRIELTLPKIEETPGREPEPERKAEQQLAADAGIMVEIRHAPRHRADAEGINDEASLELCLDDEQASDFLQHHHNPSKRRASGANRGFGAKGLW